MSESAARLFLAVPLTEEARAALAAHLEHLALPGRAVPPQSWHLTLRFLGDTPPDARRALDRSLRAAELGPPFTLRLGGYGAFPRVARASVLWLGVAEGEPALQALAAAVEEAVRAAGLPPERRPFSAHLTLSRTRTPADVRPLLARLTPFAHPLPVGEVVLYRSHLGSGPARYEAVERYPLA